MKLSATNITVITLITFFSIIFVVSFVIYPDIGEKILYGKHPPQKENLKQLIYSEIILSGEYDCMESASIAAKGSLPNFVREFNECIR